MNLQEKKTESLMDLLNVTEVNDAEMFHIERIAEANKVAILFDVNLQELVKTLNENDMLDMDIMEESQIYGSLDFYYDGKMFYLLIE